MAIKLYAGSTLNLLMPIGIRRIWSGHESKARTLSLGFSAQRMQSEDCASLSVQNVDAAVSLMKGSYRPSKKSSPRVPYRSFPLSNKAHHDSVQSYS